MKKQKLVLLVIMIMISVLIPVNKADAVTEVHSSYTYGSHTYVGISSANWPGFIFEADNNYEITKVEWWAYKVGTVSGIHAYIQEVDAGTHIPTGSVLAEVEQDENWNWDLLPTEDPGAFNCYWELETPLEVVAGNLYTVYLSGTNVSLARYYGEDGSDMGGTSKVSGEWGYYADNHIFHKVWGTLDSSGSTQHKYYIGDNDKDGWLDSGVGQWLEDCQGESEVVVDTDDTTMKVGYEEHTNVVNSKSYNQYEMAMGFYVEDGFPEGELKGANLYLWVESKINEPQLTHYYFLVNKSLADGEIDTEDYECTYIAPRPVRVSNVYSYGAFATGGWHKFVLQKDKLVVDSNDYLWLWLVSDKHYYGITPEDCTGVLEDKEQNITFGTRESIHKPYIEITVDAEPEDVEDSGCENDEAVEPITNGTVSSIGWKTTRTMYSNEPLRVDVAGTPGTPINLKVTSEAGSVIASVTDGIREGGHFCWSTSVPAATEGFIRVIESLQNVKSKWGYCTAGTPVEVVNHTSVKSGVIDYTKPMSYYQVLKEGKILFHWFVNVDSEYTDNYELKIYKRGITEMYSGTLDDVWDIIDGAEENSAMVMHRFLVVNPYAANDTYDDLCIGFNQGASLEDYGFYNIVVESKLGTAITSSDTAGWYLNNANDAAVIKFVKNQDKIEATLTCGENTHIINDIPNMAVELVVNDAVVASGSALVTTNKTVTSVTIPAGQTSFIARVRLSASNQDYEFIYQKVMTVTGAGGDDDGDDESVADLPKKADEIINKWGLGGYPGHWLILIVAMGFTFFIFRKSEILRVVIPLCLMGAAIAFGWIQQWVVILLALGVGVTVFAALRGKLAGKGGT